MSALINNMYWEAVLPSFFMVSKNVWLPLVSILFAELCWGLMAPFSKLAMSAGMSAFTLSFFRMSGAALLFWILSLFVSKEHIKLKDFPMIALAGLMSIALNQGTYVLGLSLTAPVNGCIISCTMPIWTMVFAYFILKEAIGIKRIFGISLGITGALVLILTGAGTGKGSGSIDGDLICLFSQVTVALYLVLFRNFVGRYRVVHLMKWMFLFASLMFLPFSGQDTWRDINAGFSWLVWGEAFYVVFFGTFVAYLCFVYAQKGLEPQVCSMFNYCLPVVAMVVSIALGLDVFSWVKVWSTILIFLGVGIVVQCRNKSLQIRKKQMV